MSNPQPIQVDWSTDVSCIPMGHIEVDEGTASSGKNKGEIYIREVWRTDYIWAVVERDGQPVVIRTYWIKDEERWCMHTASEKPKFLAWAEYVEPAKDQTQPVWCAK